MNADYQLYHPKWHRRRIPIFWWLKKLRYTRFILRELTSLAVVYAAVLLLVQLAVLARGPEAAARFAELLRHPVVLAIHVWIFFGLLFHTITWLNLAPRALVLRLKGKRLPDRVIILGHYLAWIVISLGIGWGLAGR